jgi:hypothetical protein
LLPSPDVEVMNTPIVEKHEMTFDEIKEMPWDNIKKAIDVYEKADKEKCLVYEITGKVDDDSDNYRIITGLDCGLEKPIVLVHQSIDNPYRKLKWEDVPGRALGRGTVEEQFESQIAVNEIEYLFRLGLQWTSKHLFWSKDLQVAKNLLSEALNGEVLGSEVSPIAMEERNLSSFTYADNKWQSHSNNQTFSSDIMRGQTPVAGTPATTSVLQSQQAGGYYNLKRQDAGIFLKSVIEDWILPDFAKEKGKAHDIHIMKLLGDDNASQKLFNATLAQEVNKKVIEFMGKGKMLSGNELQLVKSMTAAGLKGKNFSLPADFYDFDYSVDVVVTGEQIDMAQLATALQTAFQVIGSNPTILQDPVVRRTYFKLLEMTGVNPMELFDEDVPDLAQTMSNIAPAQAQVGGSIARPQPTMPATQQVPTAV